LKFFDVLKILVTLDMKVWAALLWRKPNITFMLASDVLVILKIILETFNSLF
jgi:hypothetical protein